MSKLITTQVNYLETDLTVQDIVNIRHIDLMNALHEEEVFTITQNASRLVESEFRLKECLKLGSRAIMKDFCIRCSLFLIARLQNRLGQYLHALDHAIDDYRRSNREIIIQRF